ncbi:MAG: chemotaxis protein CheW [Gemmatimonas sp.]
MTTVFRAEEAEANVADLLCFDLGAERFALPLSSIEEIVDGSNIEPARSTGGALGVLRVRGEVLPVYDATRVLQSPRIQSDPLALILALSNTFVAVLIDTAEASPRVNLDGLRTPPALIATDRVLDGVLRVGARWVGLLNASAFVDALTIDSGLNARLETGHHGR